MQLRTRQAAFVEKAVDALKSKGNTLGVAPTGAGKTVMLSAIGRRLHKPGATQLVVQHRDELTAQNRTTMHKVWPDARTFQIDARNKVWVPGAVHYGMIQTLARNLDDMPPLAVLTIDEAHHTAANSYIRLIDRARRLNPEVRILGVTATPNRGDKKALRAVFDNVCDQITIKELIQAGHLVRPRALVLDVGVREDLRNVRQKANDFDMAEVAAIMNKKIINDEVVRHWREQADGRRTVVFCSTIEHAREVTAAFQAAGTGSAVVHSELPKAERDRVLAAFDRGEFPVLTNVMVLTEGWDCQPVSCVVLLRPCSDKSVMVQMIGRGLRKVDPERYPGVHKDDCLILDFGTSIVTHGNIDQDVSLAGGGGTKDCPECAASLPKSTNPCPICGHEFPREDAAAGGGGGGASEKGDLDTVTLTEFDLLDESPYHWEPLFGGVVMMANGLEAWACVVSFHGRWHALGGSKATGMAYLLEAPEKTWALASADDFLRENGDATYARKSRRWLHEPASPAQREKLGLGATDQIGLTKYQAACWLTWKWSERGIRTKLEMNTMTRAA